MRGYRVATGTSVSMIDTEAFEMDEREKHGERVSVRPLTSAVRWSMPGEAALSSIVHHESRRKGGLDACSRCRSESPGCFV
jgi:hypothetical protein